MKKLTLKIDGMMCENCENHVNQAIQEHFPVQQVESSHARGETLILTDQDIPEDQLKAVVEEAGYRFLAMKTEEDQKAKGFFRKIFG
ncbi:MAG: heavy-metal-associated domain-containing protein [Eubacteriales bacterium]|nr:heavy-metal-associated domain-containing protein [Clostridiales bacterium]MDY5835576.1 heavy-metal-associated domain-containing protein [Eubacteriales bacterium]